MRTETEMTVAALHDVVEDGETTIDTLQKTGDSEETLIAIDGLTQRDGEDYNKFISRLFEELIKTKI